MDPKPDHEAELSDASLPWNRAVRRSPKRSRAAEYIAALYVALVLCAPWLVRDSLMLVPPSNGVEIQVVSKAIAPPAPEATARPSSAR